jgi:hypothetical protein
MALCTVINATALLVVPASGRWAVHLVHVLWWVDVALTVLSSFGEPWPAALLLLSCQLIISPPFIKIWHFRSYSLPHDAYS